jgi:hypothetical protein
LNSPPSSLSFIHLPPVPSTLENCAGSFLKVRYTLLDGSVVLLGTYPKEMKI